MRTRLAPTPSGYLHLGNLLNFQLTADLARAKGGQLALRIDDADRERVREEYLRDIFRWLPALGIDWEIGPRDLRELNARWSQVRRYRRYWRGLAELERAGVEVFVCRCSRSELLAGSCAAGCHGLTADWELDSTVVRCRPPASLGHGEPVLWRRDGIPAYHLVNLFDDIDLGISHVVRGADLADSSKLHSWLNAQLGVSISYLHHQLIFQTDGAKLSKSQGAGPLADTPELRARLAGHVASEFPRLLSEYATTCN